MLKGIPSVISPKLLKILHEMGHGDEIVLVDANYPAESMGEHHHVARLDGNDMLSVLDAIMKLLPLDTYVDSAVVLMEVPPNSGDSRPEIWDKYKEIIDKHGEKSNIEYMERFAFYERSKKAYAIVATSETALYGNILLKKGVIK